MATKSRGRKPRSTVMRARVPIEQAKRVRKLLKEKGESESQMLREAIDLWELRERRSKGIDMLISLIPDRIPTKEEYAARLGKW